MDPLTASRPRWLFAAVVACLSASLIIVFVGGLWDLISRNRIAIVESSLVAVSVALAMFRPRLSAAWFGAFEVFLDRVARKPVRALLVVGLLAFGLRAALLPLFPVPSPRMHDEFSFLLAGETFASGRLANDTHPFWKHFESFHIDQRPTYMSMYPPAQGLFLALGIWLAGNAWLGVLISSALMCSAICWALQGWLPPRWALIGGLLAVLRLGVLSYFVNSYWGGAPAALGGALVIGALPRLTRRSRIRDVVCMGLGIALLANSRPYEGFVFAALVTAFSFVQLRALSWRTLVPVGLILIMTGGWMAYYNARVFGNPWVLPYQLNRATYAVAPVFPWQPLANPPQYNHKVMREFYLGWETEEYLAARTISGRWEQTIWKAITWWSFYVGPALTLPFLLASFALTQTKFRALCAIAIFFLCVLAAGIFFNPHYAAPATALFYVLLVQGARRLQLWRWRGNRTGQFLARSVLPVSFFTLLIVTCLPTVFAKPWPDYAWYYFVPSQTPRDEIIRQLNGMPGRHLVIVRYAAKHNWSKEWVYNSGQIDDSRIVWAREMDSEQNAALTRYFGDRRVWLLEPDRNPPALSPLAR